MNAAQITHIFWKEYRTQRSVWLGMLALIVVVQLMAWSFMPPNAASPFVTLAYIGAVLSAFYALASAGVLFAGEREEQTHEWLQILPVSRVALFSGKLIWLIVSWLTVLLLTTLLAYLPDWGASWSSASVRELSSQFLTYGGRFLLWGVLSSLVCRRVYSAIALAALGFVMTWNMFFYTTTANYALAFILLTAIVVQGQRWLATDQLLPAPRLWERSRTYDLQKAVSVPVSSSPGRRMFCRELWLELQNAKWIALGLGFFLYVSAFIGPFGGIDAWFLFIPLLLGLMTFRGEHRQDQHRFQGNRGVSPLAVWSAKHLVWGGILLAGSLLVWVPSVALFDFYYGGLEVRNFAGSLIVQPSFLQDYLRSSWYHSLGPSVVLAFFWGFWMYAIGHACSVLFKRSITAALLALVFAGTGIFLTSVSLMFDVPRIIAMGLPAVCLMGFALWRTSGILSERTEPRDWGQVAGVLTLLGLVCGSSWVLWRLEELALPPLLAGIVALVPVTGMIPYSVTGGLLLLSVLLAAPIVGRRYFDGRRVFLLWSLSHIVCAVLFVSVTIGDSRIEGLSSAAVTSLTPSDEALETNRQLQQLQMQLEGNLPLQEREDGSWISMDSVYRGDIEVSDKQWAWLDANREVLNRLLEVTARPQSTNQYGYDDERLAALLRLSSIRAEQSGELASSWTFQKALLRLQRHKLQDLAQPSRGYVLRQFLSTYDIELKRWVNHPDQTPELLAQAARDFSAVLTTSFTLPQAVRLKTQQQRTALVEDNLGHWEGGGGSAEIATQITQSLHRFPWERARANLVFQKVAEHQRALTSDFELGQLSSIRDEIGSERVLETTNWHVRQFGVPLAWIPEYHESNGERASDRLWKLANTTPLFYPYGIEEFGEPPERGERQLIAELAWLRHRRLFLLNLAFRAAELETGVRPKSLAQLAELRTIDSVDSILKTGEELDGEVWNWQGNIYTHKEYREWHHRLYYDPISDKLFQIATIDNWRN